MSRNTRWKLEKTKVKVVFRLQFHATHIPQTGWNNLFISFIPTDSGKASAKTNKANVRNGTCKWADPIYETTRLLQDSKTKQYEEKLYKLVVAMGTSRSSLLGEANINLSDYMDASKPAVITLPLHGSDSGAILHVTVQLLTSKTGFREFEQQREVRDRGLPANADRDGEAAVSRVDKVNQKVRFKPETKEEESGFSEGYADSATGFDGSSNTSESLYAEKQDNSSAREIVSVKSTTSDDLGAVSASQSLTMDKGQSHHHWIHLWGDTVESDMTIIYEENSRLRGALEAADLSTHELRQEITSLQNFANSLSVETHELTTQITVEISSEQNLVKEVSMLKSECLRFKHDLEELRNLKTNPPVPGRKLEDLSLEWLNGFQNVEDKICQLQNKAFNGVDREDIMFLQSDLEALRCFLIDLRQTTEHAFNNHGEIPTGKDGSGVTEINSNKINHAMSDTGLGVELCLPEGVLLPGLLTSGTTSIDASNEMQGEIFKLLRELDESKSERDNLVQKMGQMECYYEALIQELEVNQKQILHELQNLRHEHGSCIYTVSSTKAQMEVMRQQMNNELLQYSEERCSLDALNKELERRASASEAALRRGRLNYSIAVNKLQNDLEVLSSQVVSMYEINENLIRNALSEASLPYLQDCDVKNVENIIESSSRDIIIKNCDVKVDRSLEDLNNPLKLQEEIYRRMGEELSEMHLQNLGLDIFSVTLHQALLEADLNSRKEMRELTDQLELSFRNNEFLRLNLQSISDELYSRNDEKGISFSGSNNLALENQTLEAKLRIVSDEKCIFSEKFRELESMMPEYTDYRLKYEICEAEKEKLVNQLEQAVTDTHLLSNDFNSLQEEVMTLKIKLSENERLQKVVNYMRESLYNLLLLGEEQANSLIPCSKDDKDTDCEEFVSIIIRLKECLRNFHDNIIQLTEEKTNVLNEQDAAHASFARVDTEFKVLKQEFENDFLEMVSKLNAYTALVEKLQVDFEAVSNKVQVSSEAEEKYTQITGDLFSDFTMMEDALKELTWENRVLSDMLMSFGSLNDELEGNKLTVDELKQENLRLMGLLQCKFNESAMLKKERDNLKGTLKSLQDEITLLSGIRDRLDAEKLNLNNQLKERDEKLGELDQRLWDVESEKSDLHIRLLEMHGLLIAADVLQTVVVKQFKLHVDDGLWQLEYFHQNLAEVEKKNLDLASRLSNCLADKENYIAENATFLSDLDSLKSNLETNIALNQALEHSNGSMTRELKECKEKCGLLETTCADDERNELEIMKLSCLLKSSQNEIEDLIFLKEELEIRCLVLQETLDETSVDQEMQHKKCGDLTRKLSEQIFKTEEFRNLSIHLKELRDKSDADKVEAHEKREAEKSSFASQDSLRIAFIKEQYETRLQEMQHQLSISKKHGEEMLWKLQDAVEELENRKKCEASQLKRTEELLLKITELEAELQSVLYYNREKFMAYEQLKVELDCSVMSLDCCKEEKNQLIVSLWECNDFKSKLADEVELLKEQMEYLKASVSDKQDGAVTNRQLAQETLATEATQELSDLKYSENEVEHYGNIMNDQLKPQFLLSSIERLQKELEWMRSENTLLPGDEKADVLVGEVLQRDHMNLEKVNEELENMSPLYNDSSRSGNSVERVLALELELAEVLQAKKKPENIQFTSSFLKLHKDEAAIFQSFRDINELIKDMLVMKERHATMETELKDMHERYSQLSLDFAEVEGERQMLSMMLKNARPSKRLLNWSPTSSHPDELSP